MAEITRAGLVAEVLRRFGRYKAGTVESGSTTTVVDTSALYEPDDFWIGHFAYVVEDAGGAGAAPELEERPITDYDQSTATLTVSPAFSAALAVGDTYEILPVRRADVVAAINAGIRQAGLTWPVVLRDNSSVVVVADDYDYTLPAAVARLLSVWHRDDTDENYKRLPGQLWRVGGTPGVQVLYLEDLGAFDAGDILELEYLSAPPELDNDGDTLGVGDSVEGSLVEFVVLWALYWLHDQAASVSQGGADLRAHLTLAGGKQEEAMALKKAARPMGGTGTWRARRWHRARG